MSPHASTYPRRPRAEGLVVGPQHPDLRVPTTLFGVHTPFIQFDCAEGDADDQYLWAVPFRRTSRMFHAPIIDGLLVARVQDTRSHLVEVNLDRMNRRQYRRVGYFTVNEAEIRAMRWDAREWPRPEEIELI